jgi:hypothetical protein
VGACVSSAHDLKHRSAESLEADPDLLAESLRHSDVTLSLLSRPSLAACLLPLSGPFAPSPPFSSRHPSKLCRAARIHRASLTFQLCPSHVHDLPSRPKETEHEEAGEADGEREDQLGREPGACGVSKVVRCGYGVPAPCG